MSQFEDFIPEGMDLDLEVVMGDTYFLKFDSIPSTGIQRIEGIEYNTEYVSTAHAQYHHYHVDLID